MGIGIGCGLTGVGLEAGLVRLGRNVVVDITVSFILIFFIYL